jgi:hypothetical protein
MLIDIDHSPRSLHPERRCAEECCQDVSGFRAREHVRNHCMCYPQQVQALSRRDLLLLHNLKLFGFSQKRVAICGQGMSPVAVPR